MIPLTVKITLVGIGAVALAAFVPPLAAWYRRYRHRPPVVRIGGFAIEHLSHLALVIHHALAILLLLSIDPLVFVPYHDLYAHLSPAGVVVTAVMGILLFAAGNILRVWATYAMGASFDKAVLVRQDHRLATGGPFRLSRHPIYAGNLLAEVGLGTALGSWPLVAFTLLVSLPVNNWRASREERLLLEHFGEEYRAYQSRVGRWWP